jgi:hypothetical protein
MNIIPMAITGRRNTFPSRIATAAPTAKHSRDAAQTNPNYLEMMAERFRRELKSDLLEELDPVGLQKLRGQLCEKLGGTEEMDRIDQLFRQSFMLVSPLVCWLQGAADALLGDLISRDQESSWLNFQMLTDDMCHPF